MSAGSFDRHLEEWLGRERPTDRARALEERARAIAKSEAFLAEAERAADIGSFVLHLRTRTAEYSAGFRRIYAAPLDAELGFGVLLDRTQPSDRDVIEQSTARTAGDDRSFAFQVRITRFDGAERTIRARGQIQLDEQDRPATMIGSIQDVTDEVHGRSERELLGFVLDTVLSGDSLDQFEGERIRYEERLRQLTDYDQLTGVLNRRRFDERLKHELARAGRTHDRGAVVSIDIDSFKAINDSAGHAAGDAVLVEVAHALEGQFDSRDAVARLGGDEFAVVLLSVDFDQARAAAEDLLAAIHGCRPVFGGKAFRVTASIGVAAFESDDATAGELLTGAELAMYAAKAAGRDRVVVYTPSDRRRARETAKMAWPERIREALDRDRFLLHMQPILDLATGERSHGELLLRMRDEHGRLISPEAFLPAAESSGLIHQIDRWVVHQAVQLLAGSEDKPMPKLSVNLSGESVVGDPQLLQLIERELSHASVSPDRMIFEVTETAAIANMPEATVFARRVNALGASLALDDFGTGFGSFYYLKHLPVGYVKLDGEFIQNLPRNHIDAHMVTAIVGVAQGLQIKTVAESVADEETIGLLRELGVDYAQGFHVGRPAPIS